MRSLVAASVVGALTLACRSEPGGASGSLRVSWIGADTGRLEVSAVARWCAEDSVLSILGERGDSGIGLVLFSQDSVGTGTFAVSRPGATQPRPHARVAIRWLGQNLINGYYSLSGAMTVHPATPLAGQIRATMKSAVDGRQLDLKGSFSGITIIPAAPGCGRGFPPDSSVR